MKSVAVLLAVFVCCLLPVDRAGSQEAQILITEFMASNDNGLADEDGQAADWIEIHNPGTNAVNLLDWSLTDNPTDLTKWRFPRTNLVANGYLVVFASEKNRGVPGARLHTNFKLAADGEYLALVRPDTNIASGFAPLYPPQVPNVSYGPGRVTVQTLLLDTGAVARVTVPVDDSLGLTWVQPAFDDSSWTNGPTGIGYQTSLPGGGPDFRSLIKTDVRSLMFNSNASAFIRIPFVVGDPSDFDHLTLQMKYDDGFLAYLNGTELVGDNDPPALEWNSAAASERPDSDALIFTEFKLDSERGLLQSGTNLLAIRGLNSVNTNRNFLILPKLFAATDTTETNTLRYFTVPTPGAVNNAGVANLGPIISQVKHVPELPSDTDDIAVTARVTPAFAPVASVAMRYRVMYNSNEVSVTMMDNGLSGDGVAGDGIYGATIPASVSSSGEMVRWYVSAVDTSSRVSRWPAFVDPLNSPEYDGTMISVVSTSNLPVLYWFVQNPVRAETAAGTRCSLFFNGEFYDNVQTHIRGQAARDYPKKSHKFDFNPGHRFSYDPKEERIEEMNINTTYADKAFVRVTMAWESFRDSGAPYSEAFPMRLQQNNAFYSVATFVEEPDEIGLERNGLDPNGAFYKMYGSLDTSAGNQKITRLHENFSDLQEVVVGIRASNTNRVRYLFDNINIPAMLNYLAVIVIIHDNDCPHKNYWMYRDTEGTREWQMFPWDKDLSIGRNFNGLSDEIWANLDVVPGGAGNVSPSHPLFMDQRHQKIDNQWNRLVDALYNTPAILEMYLRHLRTVMEQLLQAPDTPYSALKYERRMEELFAQMEPDVALDRAKWPYGYGAQLSFTAGLDSIRTNYLPKRRIHLFNTHSLTNSAYSLCARIPLPQAGDVQIQFGAVEPNPASGSQAEEYLELVNTNNSAVDLSGWKLSGAVQHTFQPGVVMPARSSMYVSPNVAAFRARISGPRGGQGLFVQGNYQGQLSARGETVRLADNKEREVSIITYPGQPSPAQEYLRITEIMYHPAAPGMGSPYTVEDFEYVELKNTGPVTLDLAGIRFSNGIDFAFDSGVVTNLTPGQRVLVVKNAAAFASRYGASHTIAGEYFGNLDNGGENLRLEDTAGEKVLEFSYDNSWYPVTDGLGFSLVIVDEMARFDTWGLKTSWRPSGAAHGSPGLDEPTLPVLVPVVINEILSHSVSPQVDVLELFNPTTNAANVSGWFLTDDSDIPRKYQFPSNSLILPGHFLVLDETAFNPPGAATGFAFGSKGDEAWLFSGDAAGNLTGYAHGVGFGAAEAGVSFAPYRTSTGEEHIVAQRAFTPGMTNAGPKVGPVVITEIMYHPLDVETPPGDAAEEYLELHNSTEAAVPLFDAAYPTHTWRVTGDIDFTFPTNVTLSAGGYVLLVDFDPVADTVALTAFQDRYGAAPSVPVFGPYSGKLDNSFGRVALSKPDEPVLPPATDAGFVPYVLVDEVEYADVDPWAANADGYGPSLQRTNAALYGNDPILWTAAAPSPGTTYGGGRLPSILMGPTHQSALMNQTASFSVSADGGTPLRYQWRYSAVNLPGEKQPTLALTNLQPRDAGPYSVMVYNAAGAVLSDEAALGVTLPIIVTRQPQHTNVALGGAATFSVEAFGTGTLTYLWRLNGTNLLDQTNTTLRVFNAHPTTDGSYSVVVSNEVGWVVSGAARLTTIVSPIIVQHPQSQTVLQGDNVMFSIRTVGSAPFGYRWRRGLSTLVPFGQGKATLTLTNVQLSDANSYDVIITNVATILSLSTGIVSSNAVLTVLADLDRDHLPDVWEKANGLATNNADDALLDLDGDGMTSLQEYQAGTDPQDQQSVLRLGQVIVRGEDVYFGFHGVNGKKYRLERLENMAGEVWTPVIDFKVGSVLDLELIDTGAGSRPNGIYRIHLVP